MIGQALTVLLTATFAPALWHWINLRLLIGIHKRGGWDRVPKESYTLAWTAPAVTALGFMIYALLGFVL